MSLPSTFSMFWNNLQDKWFNWVFCRCDISNHIIYNKNPIDISFIDKYIHICKLDMNDWHPSANISSIKNLFNNSYEVSCESTQYYPIILMAAKGKDIAFMKYVLNRRGNMYDYSLPPAFIENKGKSLEDFLNFSNYFSIMSTKSHGLSLNLESTPNTKNVCIKEANPFLTCLEIETYCKNKSQIKEFVNWALKNHLAPFCEKHGERARQDIFEVAKTWEAEDEQMARTIREAGERVFQLQNSKQKGI